MIKTKVVQAMVFSVIMIITISLGAVYASGNMGTGIFDASGSLSHEGELGAGLISVSILIWLWTLAVLQSAFRTWKGKSNFLIAVLVSALVMMPASLIAGIVYLAMGKHNDEKVTVVKKEKVVA